MANGSSYYDHTTYPVNGALGIAASMRAELDKIEQGFDKMPALDVAMAGRPLMMDLTGTALAVMLAFPDITNYNATTLVPGLVPKLPGNTTTFLRGDGVFAGQTAATMPIASRSSNTIMATGDVGTVFRMTSTFTQTFTAAATLGSGWFVWLRNIGTGNITLDPNGAELIDGLTSYVMYPGETRFVQCDGSAFYSTVIEPYRVKFFTTGTHIEPPGYSGRIIDAVGAGGGGGAGRRGAAGTARAGGAPGGAPARVIKLLLGSTPGTSTTVTIGAHGVGAAAQTVDDSDGADGTAGGNTTFGSLTTAYGGAGGKGGTANPTATSGSGELNAGTSGNDGAGRNGGLPWVSSVRGATNNPYQANWGTGGGGSCTTTNTDGGVSEYGGAGSGLSSLAATTVYATLNGSSMYGVSAGSAGGWITGANTLPATATRAGLNGTYVGGGGALGGTCGATPTVGADGAAAVTDDQCGNPGAGGGSTITAAQTGKKGGAGGFPGGPGGGGGASLNGLNSGAGADGADGQSIIIGVL